MQTKKKPKNHAFAAHNFSMNGRERKKKKRMKEAYIMHGRINDGGGGAIPSPNPRSRPDDVRRTRLTSAFSTNPGDLTHAGL
ncbi:hypothetical protein CEXT_463051 [Caerostris extrusa]|uniref:Uncharacterized protein n=1 Tax=Caerostris extrusa TaxID=172846 RepID=A0AAV4T653_CAEEX|nr:hypothetical protein CEXT_463051 [Caerostris extrusa]